MAHSKGEKMQVVQVIELLKQGNIGALTDVPSDVVKEATKALQTQAKARTLGVTVYDASGSVGITGIRARPIVAYKGEWEQIAAFIGTEAFEAAMANPICSTGSDDPRYEKYRADAKAKRKLEADARTK